MRTENPPNYRQPIKLPLSIRRHRRPRSPLTRVRVSGGHLCEAEAPTEAAAETPAKPQVLTEGEKELARKKNYRLCSNSRCVRLMFSV